LAYKIALIELFRTSYEDVISENFEIWPFWGEIGPFRGTLGPEITPFCGHFPRLSAQATFATKEGCLDTQVNLVRLRSNTVLVRNTMG
jgi:hypothetical protein